MIFRQLFDNTSSTYTYLLADETHRQAILIDPVFGQVRRDLALIRELGLKLKLVADTHAHADHITAAWVLKQKTGCRIASAKVINADHTDVALDDGDEFGVQGVRLKAISTPGHTDGCMSFILDGESMVFTGDTLLIRGCGRSDFQQGSAHRLYDSITGKLFALPDACLVYPAHDYQGRTVSTIGEEKA
ncbi:MAG TPA: MBL fold metallo-hydrolase, partial [Pusillimonas sp.]|nr:MBL fold metallo-hydrolase [Pusillimonas sp.]